jgi:hypothetical protein
MTRPWQECRYKRFNWRESKRNDGSGGGSGSEKSHHKGFHRQYGRRSGEWPARECQETCSGPWRVGQNRLGRSHENGKALKEVGQVGEQAVFLENDEGAFQDMWGGRSNGGRASLTVWDIILTVWEAARGDKRAGRPHSRSGGLLGEIGWGYEKWHGGELRWGAPAVMRALPEMREDRWRPYWQKLKIQNVATINVFFLLRFSGNHVFTPRMFFKGMFNK